MPVGEEQRQWRWDDGEVGRRVEQEQKAQGSARGWSATWRRGTADELEAHGPGISCCL